VKTYEFTLKFSIPDLPDKGDIEERLFKAGCDDALVATGLRGRLALDFSRQSRSAEQAINSALKAVTKALPEASLIEACPDLVGVSDIAELLSFSRQNMQKLIRTHAATFPSPLHDGTAGLWHLADVLRWFEQHQARHIEREMLDMARASRLLNLSRELGRLNEAERRKCASLLAS
jgi:predicted DNA-binding transcriptional regulator AlpA